MNKQKYNLIKTFNIKNINKPYSNKKFPYKKKINSLFSKKIVIKNKYYKKIIILIKIMKVILNCKMIKTIYYSTYSHNLFGVINKDKH